MEIDQREIDKKYGYNTLKNYCTKNKVILLEEITHCMSSTKVKGKCLDCPNGVFHKQVINLIKYGAYCKVCISKIHVQRLKNADWTNPDKVRFNLDFLIDFQEQTGLELLEEFKEQINKNTIIKGKCITTGCSDIFEKRFELIVKKGGPFCSKCTQSNMSQKLSEAKWTGNSRKRWDLAALGEFCKEQSIKLVGKYTVVNRDTMIKGFCVDDNCNEIFERRFRWIVDPRGSGAMCAKCCKIKADEISRQNIKKHNESLQKEDTEDEKEEKTTKKEKNEEEKIEKVQSFDIVDYIEKNPDKKLLFDYESKILSKIKENFTEEEQQIYVTSFYCYLNYDSEKDFVIDFDDVWKWCGFTRRDNAIRLLEKHFVKDVDYKVSNSAFAIGGAKFDPEISGDEKEEMKEKIKKSEG